MIELNDVQFAYAEGGFALRVPSLCISQRQRACWTGPSGSGKSTLLHLVAGIFSPASGFVKTCGVELTGLGDAARRDFRIANVGLVFQDFVLLDYLSVLDNILLPFRISRSLKLEPSVRSRVHELMRSVGLDGMLSRRPTQLSQGERQRVAVCRAIIANPNLVLADEPTANLDADSATLVLDALEDYATRSAAALIVVSHDRDVMARFAETTPIAEFCTATPSERVGGADDA